MALQEILSALQGNGLKPTGADKWSARCPAHDDRKASLTLGMGAEGRVLVMCMAGCKTDDVMAALELPMSALFEEKPQQKSTIVATYDYRDEQGKLLYQVVRFDPKDFRQRRPGGPTGWEWKLGDVRRVLYRLPELLAAPPDAPVFVVEGEKDADALAQLGLVATTNVGGAGPGKWRPEYTAALKGRRTVVIADNDDVGIKHARDVGLAVNGKSVVLPGPPKSDVSDWLAAGGTVEKLMAMAAAAPVFQRSPERLDGERAERVEMGGRALPFGVKYLDDALGGITPRDLVIFGAKTGVGKTALATNVALHNCQAGRRVHYFALEAEDREIERRMKFQILATLYYQDRNSGALRYLDWYMGRLDRELGRYEDVADMELRRILRNLHTFYRVDNFTSDDFCQQIERIKGETDLVILDHLHYVDSDDENENRGYKRTVKQIRDSALRSGKPVIVVAHVRKGDRRLEPLVPTVEDFHGSSDIPKMATKAVMLAPNYEAKNAASYLWSTYIQVSKCRLDSSVTRYVANVTFNTRTNAYEAEYELGRLTEGGKVFSVLPANEMPNWARALPFNASRMQQHWSEGSQT